VVIEDGELADEIRKNFLEKNKNVTESNSGEDPND
jgi:hypothetical protein